MTTFRLFIAVEIPSEIRSQIVDIISELKSANADVRWEAPEKQHITLKFLGDTELSSVNDINAALEQIGQQTLTFTIAYSSLGCFPNKREPRIIWIGGKDGDRSLEALAASIEGSMIALRFPKEEREFHPHVTIGRVKSQRNMPDLLRRMESITFESHPVQVSQFVLIKSELKQSGSVYTILSTFPLHQQ